MVHGSPIRDFWLFGWIPLYLLYTCNIWCGKIPGLSPPDHINPSEHGRPINNSAHLGNTHQLLCLQGKHGPCGNINIGVGVISPTINIVTMIYRQKSGRECKTDSYGSLYEELVAEFPVDRYREMDQSNMWYNGSIFPWSFNKTDLSEKGFQDNVILWHKEIPTELPRKL